MTKKTPLLFFTLALTSCATLHSGNVMKLSSGDKYVSMGSSFAAGPGIGTIQPGTPERCHRSTANYATQVAKAMNLTLFDVSCGGAKTVNILEPWQELPAQINAVTSSTRLVTITIGGNDLDYVLGLAAASCRANPSEQRSPCRTAQAPSEEDYNGLERRLREIALRVHSQAPNSRLIFIQYLTLVPRFACNRARLSTFDAHFERDVGLKLAQITRKVVRETHSEVLPVDIESRDHTACSPEPWSNGTSLADKSLGGISWHPNAAGMRSIANMILETLQK